jgi:hypothetical protein
MKVHKYGLLVLSISHADEFPLAAQEMAASFVHRDFRGIFVESVMTYCQHLDLFYIF